jgi:hypothetical protein
VVGLGLALFILVGNIWHTHPSSDYYWSLVNGEWMVRHHEIITKGLFSYTLRGHPIISTEWAYDYLLGWAQHFGGGPGTVWLATLIGVLALVALANYLFILGARRGIIGWTLVLVSLVGPALFDQQRALGIGVVFFLVELTLIHVARKSAWWLLAIPALLAVWINFHASALLGVGVLVVEVALAPIPTSRVTNLVPIPHRWYLLATLAVSVLLLGATPWGWRLAWYDGRIATNSQLAAHITEWQPARWGSPGVAIVLVATLIVLTWVLYKKTLNLEVVLVVLLLLGTLHTGRVIAYLLLITAALFAAELQVLAPPKHAMWDTSLSAHARRFTMAVVVAAGITAGLLIWSGPIKATSPSNMPVAALTKLSTLPPGRLFTEYSWASYGVSRGFRSFMDGQTDLFLWNGIYSTFFQVADITKNPNAVLTRYHVRYVLWSPDRPLSHYLHHSSNWLLVYHNHTSELFERT